MLQGLLDDGVLPSGVPRLLRQRGLLASVHTEGRDRPFSRAAQRYVVDARARYVSQAKRRCAASDSFVISLEKTENVSC